jgi:hypothetical protein
MKVFRRFVSFTRMSITTSEYTICYAFVIIFQSHPTEHNICTSKCLSNRIEVYRDMTLNLCEYCVAIERKCDTICRSLHYVYPAQMADLYTGRFIMHSGITKIYYRKTVGHVFTKPAQIEGTTQIFFPQ